MPYLLGESLVKGKRTGFTTTIIRHFAQTQKAARARDGDDMAMVPFEHCGQEFAHGPVVGYRVDLEHEPDHGLGFVEDGAFLADTGVVDEHRWIAVVSADVGGGLVDAGGGCDVAFVEEYIFCFFVRQLP